MIAAFIGSLVVSNRRLRQERAFTSSILDSTSALIVVHNNEGRIIDFNKACEIIAGYEASEVLGHEFNKLPMIPKEITSVKRGDQDQKANQLPFHFESCWLVKDGKKHIIDWSYTKLKNINGRVQWILTGIDITERKRAEEQIQKSEDHLRMALNAAWMGTWEWDIQSGKVIWSENIESIFGLSKGEFDGTYDAYLNLLHLEDREVVEQAINKALKHGKEYEVEHRIFWPDKSIRWLGVKGKVYHDKAGNPFRMAGTVSDITERKQVEEMLKKSRQQFQNLSVHLQSVTEQERTRIAREIHDELGQALSILQINLTWLENQLPKENKSWLEKIESMSKLIETTIQKVQSISRELRPSVLDNLGLIAAIEWQAKEFQKHTGIQCKINLMSEEIELNQDIMTALFRILQEALTNVARHSKAKLVKVNLAKNADNLILKIQDNGKGITEKQISDPKSMGFIGMKERVNFVGGEFKIQGTPNKGTTLRIGVPLKS